MIPVGNRPRSFTNAIFYWLVKPATQNKLKAMSLVMERRMPDGQPPNCASCVFCRLVSQNRKIGGHKYKSGDAVCINDYFIRMIKSDAAVHILSPIDFCCVFFIANEARTKSLNEALLRGNKQEERPKVPEPTKPFDPYDL